MQHIILRTLTLKNGERERGKIALISSHSSFIPHILKMTKIRPEEREGRGRRGGGEESISHHRDKEQKKKHAHNRIGVHTIHIRNRNAPFLFNNTSTMQPCAQKKKGDISTKMFSP